MDCLNCHTANDEGRKFCKECGAPLGSFCQRCKNVGDINDKFCGVCGNTLALNAQESLFSPPENPGAPKQYSPEEVHDLLSLRKIVRLEEAASARVTQSDVDSIFS
jgi:RNA polymerase subunit RPABC4/transcription elongation factor Spt4